MVREALACSQKKAQEEERTIVWIDEAGFYLLPMAVRTWAPRGKTPVLRVPLTRDHLIFHQRHYPRWAAVPASASSLLRCRRSGGLPTCALAQDPRETPRHLGWFADPSRTRDQRVSQARGVGQCLLCQSGSPLYCAHSSERALAAQARGHSQLFATMWLFGLVS